MKRDIPFPDGSLEQICSFHSFQYWPVLYDDFGGVWQEHPDDFIPVFVVTSQNRKRVVMAGLYDPFHFGR